MSNTKLSIANRLFRELKYAQAIELYKEILFELPAIADIVRFNVYLAEHRLSQQAISDKQPEVINTVVLSDELTQPLKLDQYTFDQIIASDLFDAKWYVNQYQQYLSVGTNPLEHYLDYGVQKGLDPSSKFNTSYYLAQNDDVAQSDTHPFVHYVLQGVREGRLPVDPTAQYGNVGEASYVPLITKSALRQKSARLICFYLPQFHAIPENDEWWGEGFTEWTNVKPAKPYFQDHYQPHVPDELGYYNLTETSTQQRQIELAKLYGIEGFCFYFYWFGGKRLLETPVENYLNNPSLDLPFCLCWANENWSRRWDGLESEILISQQHSPEDDLAFIQHISQYMHDGRYIRIDGKPLLLVYRPSLLPNAKETSKRWRQWCREAGLGEIYLAYTQSFEAVDPKNYDFDAAIEFPPNNTSPPNITTSVVSLSEDFASTVYDWRALVERSKSYKKPKYKLFRGVNPSWDNTARRKNKASILMHSSPCGYQEWLYNAINDTCQRFGNTDERLIFVNAWNEWAEGAHLEPDQRYGYAWLEATRMAQIRTLSPTFKNTSGFAIVLHAFYEDVFSEIIEHLKEIKNIPFKLFVTTPHVQRDSLDATLRSSGFSYHLMPVDNRGRDVLPFLKIMDQVIEEGYAYILKIHTKKSHHRKDGEIWRNDLYNKLLNENAMHMALSSFKNDVKLGVIGPAGHVVSMDFYWGSNAQTVKSLAHRMGQTPEQIKSLSFVAGTMFFARSAALTPLMNLAIGDEDFEGEAGQIDGTLAHALERAISISCKAGSYVLTDTNLSREQHTTANYRFVSKE